jgi:hypothetical protein
MARLLFVHIAHTPLYRKEHLVLANASSTMCDRDVTKPGWKAQSSHFALSQEQYEAARHDSDYYCQICNNQAARLSGLAVKPK